MKGIYGMPALPGLYLCHIWEYMGICAIYGNIWEHMGIYGMPALPGLYLSDLVAILSDLRVGVSDLKF